MTTPHFAPIEGSAGDWSRYDRGPGVRTLDESNQSEITDRVDNIITRVEYDYRPAGDGEYPEHGDHPDDPGDRWTGFYRVFVFADNQQINLMQFDGSDGNGYYGTGFEILVRDVDLPGGAS